jgi:hypothetical protein
VDDLIEVATGDLIVGGLRIGPGLSRSAFLQSPQGAASTVEGRSGPWCSFGLIEELAGVMSIVEERDGNAIIIVSYRGARSAADCQPRRTPSVEARTSSSARRAFRNAARHWTEASMRERGDRGGSGAAEVGASSAADSA